MTCIATDSLVASALVFDGKNQLRGISVNTDGTNAATVIVYDNTTAAGKILMKVAVPGASLHGGFSLDNPARAENGLYVSIAGTGAHCNVYFGE